MVCQTVKAGAECVFMSKKGCNYNGGTCHPIVDSCNGCDRVAEYPTGLYCKAYSEPALKWVTGSCTLATHVKKITALGRPRKLIPSKHPREIAGTGKEIY